MSPWAAPCTAPGTSFSQTVMCTAADLQAVFMGTDIKALNWIKLRMHWEMIGNKKEIK